MKNLLTITFFCTCSLLFQNAAAQTRQDIDKTNSVKRWQIQELLKNNKEIVQLDGHPKRTKCQFGKTVTFNGIDEGITLDTLPISGLDKMTIEVIFHPTKGGNFEQRFLHFGEIKGDRILMEMRSVEDNWYLDAFVCSDSQKKVLVNPDILHPLNTWYHIAFVIDHNSLSTYVNHKLEMQETYNFQPITKGKTSIGVRQNKVSWFKGDIYEIKISPTILKPNEFISLTDTPKL